MSWVANYRHCSQTSRQPCLPAIQIVSGQFGTFLLCCAISYGMTLSCDHSLLCKICPNRSRTSETYVWEENNTIVLAWIRHCLRRSNGTINWGGAGAQSTKSKTIILKLCYFGQWGGVKFVFSNPNWNYICVVFLIMHDWSWKPFSKVVQTSLKERVF